MKLNPFKIWFKKTKYFGRKNILAFLYIILPLLIFNGIILGFFNQYYYSFEEYSYREVGPDIIASSRNEDFQEINHSLEKNLGDTYEGMLRVRLFFLDSLNLSLVNPTDGNVKSSFNEIYSRFKSIKFSSPLFRNEYINKFTEKFEGAFPTSDQEIITSFRYKETFNLSVGSILRFTYNSTISFNVSVSGFFGGKDQYKLGPDNSLYFINYGLNEKLLKIHRENYDLDFYNQYYIYLNHYKMDVFNINSFIATLERKGNLVEDIFKEHTKNFDVNSLASNYLSSEFEVFMNKALKDFYVLVAPIVIIGLIFTILLSRYINEREKNYWIRIKVYLSEKQLLKQTFLDLLLNGVVSYFIALPLSIGLYKIVNNASFFQSYVLYIPVSFYITTIIFVGFFLIISYYYLRKFILMLLNGSDNEKKGDQEKIKIPMKYLLILLVLILSPLLQIFMNYFAVIFYNPLIAIFNSILYLIKDFATLFYSSLLIVFFIVSFVRFFPRILHYFSKISFRKNFAANFKLNSLKNFFKTNNKYVLFLTVILSLELGFINYYIFTNINRTHQEEVQIYLKYGADHVIYEDFSYNNITLNLSIFIEEDNFCTLKSLKGKVTNQSVMEPNFALLSFDPERYYNVLNNHSQRLFPEKKISVIKNLKEEEILIPYYYHLRYGIEIGDQLETIPHNHSREPPEFSNQYHTNLRVKGFFNFLPGFDQSRRPFNSVYSPWFEDKGFIGIASPSLNFSSAFPDIPTQPIHLVKESQGEDKIQQMLFKLETENRTLANSFLIESLEEELVGFQGSYSKISIQIYIVIFSIFILIFFLISIVFIYNYVSVYKGTWNLLQLFGMPKFDVRRFISKSLIGIYFLSFLFGFLGILSGSFILFCENLGFKYQYYCYPIELIMDPLGLLLNFIFLVGSFIVILIYIFMISDFKLEYNYIRKYNPE